MLNIFIGAPADRQDDSEAVGRFLAETGEKIILGGTAISIFERETGSRAEVDLTTGSEGIPPYGSIAGMMAAEATVTLAELNRCFTAKETGNNAVSILRKKLMNTEAVRIYRGHAANRINGIDKESVVSDLIANIKKSGINPDIVDY